jgi:hypothetical protein
MMPRVTPLPSTVLAPDLAEVYETFVSAYGPFRDQAAVLAHVPPALDHLCSMLMELKQRRVVPWRYIELAIVVVSNRFNDALQIDDGRTAADGAESFAGVQHPRRSNGP